MVAAGWQHFGRIDVLVNNAGVAAESTIMPERIPHELFEQTMRVNLLGTWYCCREVAARQLADGKGGSIVNLASIAGMVGVADFPSAYQASKAAVINLTRNLAASWADRGIRVNAIAPGWFPSEMTGAIFGIPDFHRWVSEAAPQGRVGEPAELAGPLLLLASNAGSFMTGHVLVVDGGPVGDRRRRSHAAKRQRSVRGARAERPRHAHRRCGVGPAREGGFVTAVVSSGCLAPLDFRRV